jgi:uncharacterized protein YndB with AHSA1/START domain
MPAKTSDTAALDARSMIITRVLSAPRERAFDAWTKPEVLARWFGPNGFTLTTSKHDFRPGGTWRFVMHGPDGTDYQNIIRYDEIVRPERIAYRHGDPEGDPAADFQNTITFEPVGDRTLITLRAVFSSAEARDRVAREHHAVEGGQQTLGRLDAELGGASGADSDFVIERTFDAARDLVWKAHTEAERLAKWWGPVGFKMLSCKLDLKPGGLFHYGMKAPNGSEMWGRFVFREVTPQTRLAYVVSFSDADAGVTRHPMSKTWPLEVMSLMTLADDGHRTKLTLRGWPINAQPDEIASYGAAKPMMTNGFKGTLDQLDTYLASS